MGPSLKEERFGDSIIKEVLLKADGGTEDFRSIGVNISHRIKDRKYGLVGIETTLGKPRSDSTVYRIAKKRLRFYV